MMVVLVTRSNDIEPYQICGDSAGVQADSDVKLSGEVIHVALEEATIGQT